MTGRLDDLIDSADVLLRTADTGRMTSGGVKLAIVGAPNTGKSSLMNLLLNEDRVIVSDIPGTTRDVVEDELILVLPAVPVKPGTEYVEGTWGDAADETEEPERENPFEALKKVKFSR